MMSYLYFCALPKSSFLGPSTSRANEAKKNSLSLPKCCIKHSSSIVLLSFFFSLFLSLSLSTSLRAYEQIFQGRTKEQKKKILLSLESFTIPFVFITHTTQQRWVEITPPSNTSDQVTDKLQSQTMST